MELHSHSLCRLNLHEFIPDDHSFRSAFRPVSFFAGVDIRSSSFRSKVPPIRLHAYRIRWLGLQRSRNRRSYGRPILCRYLAYAAVCTHAKSIWHANHL